VGVHESSIKRNCWIYVENEQKSANKVLLAVGWRIVVGLATPSLEAWNTRPGLCKVLCLGLASRNVQSRGTDARASLPRLALKLAAGTAKFKLGMPGTLPAAPTLRIRQRCSPKLQALIK
jgi:hypothetical protein